MLIQEYYDRGLNPIVVGVGDKVLLRDEARHKHESIFKGPYVVTEINEPNLTIKDQNGRTKIVHKNNVNKLNN